MIKIMLNMLLTKNNNNGFEYIHYEDIDEGKFEYVKIMTIKEYSDCEVTFARLTCNTENL